MKIFSFSLAFAFSFLLFLSSGSVLAGCGDPGESPCSSPVGDPQQSRVENPGQSRNEKAMDDLLNSYEANDHNTANLNDWGFLTFGGPKSFGELAVMIMSFLGRVIIFAAVLGFMIGGGMMVFSAGDEGLVSRGKEVLIASIIGLSVTLLAYLIVELLQGTLYGIGT